MIRKSLYILATIAAAFLSSSCNKWLEATASGQVSDEQMFSTRAGFLEALSGVYIDMASEDCYGMNYTWYAVDLIAYPYSSNSSLLISIWQTHRYNNGTAKSIIKDMWRGAYNIIANANRILTALEETTVISNEEEKQLIKGELLAIRAYVHFDLVRLFGPAGYQDEDKKKLTVPYLTTYAKTPPPQNTLEQTLSLILKDIDDALTCLEKDPVTGNESETFMQVCNMDGYWNGRLRHLNYYAVLALKARVLVWMEKTAEAAAIAKTVEEEAVAKGAVSWIDADALIKSTDYDANDWTFSCEHLFSLDVTDLYSKVRPLMFQVATATTSAILVDPQMVDIVFNPGIIANLEDVRGPALMMSFSSKGYTLNKFYGSSSQKAQFRDRMPMLRLSEMRLLRIEGELAANNLTDARDLLMDLFTKRAITDFSNAIPAEGELDLEYLKEFAGEGQLFFYEKRSIGRHAISSRLYNSPLMGTGNADVFVFPFPQEELTFGRVQE